MNLRLSNTSFKGISWVAGCVLALAGTALAETTTIVTPGNMDTWGFTVTDPTTGSASMVTGPTGAPLGVGSANLQAGNGTAGGDQATKIQSTSALNGVFLSDVTALGYWTYNTSNAPNDSQFPYLKLFLSWAAGSNQASSWSAGSDAIYFEPPYQTSTYYAGPDQEATQMNTWQSWNALEGGWWDDNSKCGPGISVCSLSTLSSLLGVPLSALMIDGSAAPQGDGLSLRVGSASADDVFNGNVDDFTIGIDGNTVAYDFEPTASTATPEPGTLALLGMGLGLVGIVGRKRRQA